MNTVQPMYKWSDIPWQKLERNIYKLQKRIYKASSRNDVKTVRRLQKLLTKSWAAKCLAVRRVTQDNQGKKTAGVDGVKSLTPNQRLTLVNRLKLGSKVAPTRRVWIPKPGKDEKRPLGIPTINDRALQGLVKLALEPEWEARFEPNAYGFRPGRSCHDAIGAIFNAIRYKPKFVLDADISKCFDKIDHQQLIKKLNTYPTLRKQIRAWLKAGVIDGKELFTTSEGVPQGGTLSPLLANIALHGMEYKIKELAKDFDMRDKKGHLISISHRKKSISLIRYADDLVIIHESLTVVQRCREIISEWLINMGLELKPSKTRLIHTLQEHDAQKPGFNFLGFNIRQFKAGKYTSGKNTQKQLLGFSTIITPSKESQKVHYNKIREVIDNHKAQSQANLIKNLNPIIRGWCNYFLIGCPSKTFYRMDYILYWKLKRWAKRRHSNKGEYWISHKYWRKLGLRNWAFATKSENNPYTLIEYGSFKSISYAKVRNTASPYDGNLTYWSTRMGKHPQMPKRTASLLKKQKGKCTHCGLFFQEKDVIETDHIIPTAAGGKDEYKNLQLLHRHCHDEKTKSDLEMINNHRKEKRIKELYKWFNKLDWIWKDDIPTLI